MLVFITAYQLGKTISENAQALAALEGTMQVAGVTYTEVQGCYGGVSEPSYKVQATNLQQVAILASAANAWNQDSILIANDDGTNAHLLMHDGSIIPLGNYEECPEEDCLESGNYTYDNGKYYACVPA